MHYYKTISPLQQPFTSHLMAHLDHADKEGLFADRVESQVHHVPHSLCYCGSVVLDL